MEEFKPFHQLFEADERWKFFVLRHKSTGQTEPYTLQARYDAIASIELHPSVPDDILDEHNTAKMLCVYAWLYYPFHQAAEQKAFATLEMALGRIYPNIKKDGLKKLLSRAVNNGVITDAGFSHIKADESDPMKYTRTLPNSIPDLRNAHAHGERLLHPHSEFTVRNCAEIINQLYPNPSNV